MKHSGLLCCFALLCFTALPVALRAAPLAAGNTKNLGGIYSTSQAVNFTTYWNQVTPENAGKWGSVEAVRDVMNWTELDAAYSLAKSNGYPFRFHVLFWGAQQPAWMRDLSDAEQLEEIHEWLAAVAARYPDIDYLEVVNEAFHDQPDSAWKWLTFVDNSTDANCGNYKKALGGNGTSGWDWVLNAFRLARQYFPNTKLVLNEYGIISDGNATNNYVALINLLKAENLVDVVAEQAHAFNTSGASVTTITNNLNTIGATGVPVWITEFDIDGVVSSGSTTLSDSVQSAEYQRVFPALWNNPYVIGITTWGYRPGLWRNTQAAYLVLSDGTERSAMTWLKSYLAGAGANPNRMVTLSTQPVSRTISDGATTAFTVAAFGSPAPTYQWQKNSSDISGATNATFTLTPAQLADAGTYRVVVTNSYNSVTSAGALLTVNAVAPAITTQPLTQTVTAGANATLSVAASGSATLTYQWRKNTVDISGATGSSYAITNAQPAAAGSYTVVVTNSAGSATSDAAILTVDVPLPTITTQPASRTVLAGSNVTLAVVANGATALTYQWRKDTVDISGATGSSYVITNLQAGTTGAYTVVVSMGTGSVTSAAATVSIGTIPDGFDASTYLARYPVVAAVYGTDLYGAWIYYRNTGIYQGDTYDELFRVEEYLSLYPELFAIFGSDLSSALMHWLTQGRIEGKLGRIPLEFSATGYFSRNPDVATAVGNNVLLAWNHYWLYGIYEGRAYDDELRVFEYLAINADLTTAFVNDWRQAALHWMRYGRNEGRLGRLPLLFDVPEYLTRNPDVAAAWGTYPTTVFLHYWAYGVTEGRTFDDLFRASEYLNQNPDLAAVFGTNYQGAFKHWVRYGKNEGRRGRNP